LFADPLPYRLSLKASAAAAQKRSCTTKKRPYHYSNPVHTRPSILLRPLFPLLSGDVVSGMGKRVDITVVKFWPARDL